MEGYFSSKMKRKDLDDVNDKFSDFSLTSPARKIRRLDGELPPIVEEDEYEIPTRLTQSLPQKQSIDSQRVLKIEELPREKEEKAIVLFRPWDTHLLKSPSNFSVSVDPQFISEFSNQVMLSNQSNSWKLTNSTAVSDEKNSCSSNRCLAVVPWIPPLLPSSHVADFPSQVYSHEMMDAEEEEEISMDYETDINESSAASHLHQWQQQNCMFSSHNSTTPVFGNDRWTRMVGMLR